MEQQQSHLFLWTTVFFLLCCASRSAAVDVRSSDGTVACSCNASSIDMDCQFQSISLLPNLAECSNLTTLLLDGNDIPEISQLSSLPKLKVLQLQFNRLSNISALSTLTRLTELKLSNNPSLDLGPISTLTQLTTLFLGACDIEDLKPLSSLTRLTELSLNANEISDLRPLSPLTQLTTLRASSNAISDIVPLSSLTQLSELELLSNKISEITGLSDLTRLTDLRLTTNRISSLVPLTAMTKLRNLQLSSNHISDLSPLGSLTNLDTLTLAENELTEIGVLAPLTKLTSLSLNDNLLTEIGALTQLTNLTFLSLSNNFLSNLESLSPLQTLHVLLLDYNQISDLVPLVPLKNLYHLSLHGNQITDLEGLTLPPKLTILHLSKNKVSDLWQLSTLVHLKDLRLSSNNIVDLKPLESLTSLTNLRLEENEISDLTPIGSLTRLSTLMLSSNAISDLEPLASLTTLTTLLLDHNEIVDIQPLGFLSQLSSLGLTSNYVANIATLSSLVQLDQLYLSNNNISDLSPISGLLQMEELLLSDNDICDISSLSSLTNLTYLDLGANRLSQLEPISTLTQLTDLRLYTNDITDIRPIGSLSVLNSLDLHDNKIRGISSYLGRAISEMAAFYMEGNPSVCIRALNPISSQIEVVCDCAPGYYGTDFCGSIQEDLIPLPGIISKLSSKCFKNPNLATPFCPSEQLTDENLRRTQTAIYGAQDPSKASILVNTTEGTTEVGLSWVYSAFKVQNALLQNFNPILALEISVTTGLNTTLEHGSFMVLPNPHIPSNITYNASYPLPEGITFNNQSSETWFAGKPNSTSKDSIGRFNVTVIATEHFTGQTKVAAHVLLDITTCGKDTCNQRGTCSPDPNNSYRPLCACNQGYSGEFCEARTDTRVDTHSSLAEWVAPVIVVIVLLLSGAIAVYYWKSKRLRRLKVSAGLTEQLLNDRDEELQEIHSSWDIPWSDLALGKEIGTGAFGSVVTAVWQGNEVAVKRMKTSQDFTAELFEKEVRSMTLLRHPNLVTFYGTGTDTAGLRFLVVEYLANGSLRDVLNNTEVAMDWSLQINICRDIALGMAFLHTRSPPVMHRDLKADNCFVSSSWTVKVGDFGSILRSKSLELHKEYVDGEKQENVLSQLHVTATFGCGTPLWMAPEVIATARHGAAQYGLRADVFSYSIVMYEVATRDYPYAEKKDIMTHRLLGEVQDGLRPIVPSILPPAFVELMTQCWNSDPVARPSFNDVCRWFEETGV